ncbi:GNAT family N-acetyltransferase [Streptomyces sp. JNUCC 64]
MRIRAALAADAAGVARVHVRAWQKAFAGIVPAHHLDALDPVEKARTWEGHIAVATADPGAGVLVAEDDVTDGTGHGAGDRPGITAFACYRPTGQDPRQGELSALYAHPDHWGTGVGRELMAAVETAMTTAGYREATLWVLADNTRARRFYETAGWSFDGTVTQDHDGGAVLDKLRYARVLADTQT